MRRFRKKPVVIEAVQWTGDNLPECTTFLGDSYGGPWSQEALIVLTLEGQHIASQNDWLIRGVKGEHYPCKPDIFAATYDVFLTESEDHE